jgi:hypothetical protein
MEPRYWQLAGSAAETVRYLTGAPEPGAFALASRFYEAYRQLALGAAIDVQPGPEGALAYVATDLLLQATEAAAETKSDTPRGLLSAPRAQAQSESEVVTPTASYGGNTASRNWLAIGNALHASDGFETIIGRVAFDESGRRSPMTLYLYQISHLRAGETPLAMVSLD